CMQGLELYTF
nr:immunoglobulin light chain junction region [Macaca mulatta]MOV62856.1 immunoglobulin light chain junction region [Macaca mulatta]MOV63286.1 immunoglobulin light chain junction region [Macaca mulatta]MOV64318.1 immunoglobulin light chain junction region [Macaca mulatta]